MTMVVDFKEHIQTVLDKVSKTTVRKLQKILPRPPLTSINLL